MEAHKFNGQAYELNLCDHLRIGQFIDVELKAVKRRFRSKLIGFKDSEYFVIELPDVKKYGYLRDSIEEQSVLIIRTIFEKTSGECIAFTSRAMAKLTFPDKLLFISFPKDVVSKELRREERETVSIFAKIFQHESTDDDKKVSGIISNISQGGCAFELHAKNIAGVKQGEVFIEFECPQKQEPMRLKAEVRSQRKEGTKILVGMAFCDGSEYNP